MGPPPTAPPDLDSEGFRTKIRNKFPVLLPPIISHLSAVRTVQEDNSALFPTFFGRDETLSVFTSQDNRQFVKGHTTVEEKRNVYDTCAHIFGHDRFPGSANNTSQWVEDGQRVYLRSSVPVGVWKEDEIARLETQLFGPNADQRAPTDKLSPHNQLMWISSKGCVTPLHYDRCHGCLCQVIGRKRVILIDPDDTSSVYQCSLGSGPSHTSRVDVFAALQDGPESEKELTMFPKMRDVPHFDFVLQPGQCLYIPVGWWHAVLTLEPSLSVTFAFDPAYNEQLPSCMLR